VEGRRFGRAEHRILKISALDFEERVADGQNILSLPPVSPASTMAVRMSQGLAGGTGETQTPFVYAFARSPNGFASIYALPFLLAISAQA